MNYVILNGWKINKYFLNYPFGGKNIIDHLNNMLFFSIFLKKKKKK